MVEYILVATEGKSPVILNAYSIQVGVVCFVKCGLVDRLIWMMSNSGHVQRTLLHKRDYTVTTEKGGILLNDSVDFLYHQLQASIPFQFYLMI